MRHPRHHKRPPAELEITSFLNLMIILVPVLLVMMVFSRITIVELSLPSLNDPQNPIDEEKQQVEVVLYPESIGVNFPKGVEVRDIPKKDGEYDFENLSLTLQEVKRLLKEQGVDKRDAMILSQPDSSYQAIISTIDAVRSFKTVLVTDVVDAELFPEVSLGDAPVNVGGKR